MLDALIFGASFGSLVILTVIAIRIREIRDIPRDLRDDARKRAGSP
jgi:hypothetical protein